VKAVEAVGIFVVDVQHRAEVCVISLFIHNCWQQALKLHSGDVVEKNIDLSLKSNPLCRRGKNYDSGVIVEKYRKSTNFHKNSCNLLTAVTHTKILVAYFIISDNKR